MPLPTATCFAHALSDPLFRLQPQPKSDFIPAQSWWPRMPHTCWVLTRKRTAWRALVLVAALMWVWAQGELGVLSVVRLGRWSWVPLSWTSWRRYSTLCWLPSWRESRDWSCSRSMEPSRIMESGGGQRKMCVRDKSGNADKAHRGKCGIKNYLWRGFVSI